MGVNGVGLNTLQAGREPRFGCDLFESSARVHLSNAIHSLFASRDADLRNKARPDSMSHN
jgi:hypothetical protein